MFVIRLYVVNLIRLGSVLICGFLRDGLGLGLGLGLGIGIELGLGLGLGLGFRFGYAFRLGLRGKHPTRFYAVIPDAES